MSSVESSDRLPAVLLAVLLASLPFGLGVAGFTDSPRWGEVATILPFVVALGAWRGWRRLRQRRGTPTPPAGTTAVDDSPTSRRTASVSLGYVWLVGFGSLAAGLAVITGGTYLRQFWFVAIAGLAAIVGFWGHRNAGNFRGAIAFVGVFVALYGVLGLIVQVLAR